MKANVARSIDPRDLMYKFSSKKKKSATVAKKDQVLGRKKVSVFSNADPYNRDRGGS